MQIILSREEIQVINDALLTEKKEAQRDYIADERRGRDLKYVNKRIEKINALMKRFEPYIK